MRKAIITLLAVLMLVSFVSCDDQKVTEEMREQAMKDFVETMGACGQYVIPGERKDAKYDLSNWNSTTADDAEIGQIKTILEQLVGTVDITSAKGTVEIKDVEIKKEDSYEEVSLHIVANGVEIAYTQNGEKEILTLDCDMSATEFENEKTKESGGSLIERKFVLNGKTYKPIEYAARYNGTTETRTITKAVCDGIDLDCDKLAELIRSQMQ